MSKQGKLLTRMRNNPVTVSFDELDTVLRSYGFEARQPKGGSSHTIYSRKGHASITVPFKRPHVKKIYVKHVLALIDEVIEKEGLE